MRAIAFTCSHCQYSHPWPAPMWEHFALWPDFIHFSVIDHQTKHRIGATTERLSRVDGRLIVPADAQAPSPAQSNPHSR